MLAVVHNRSWNTQRPELPLNSSLCCTIPWLCLLRHVTKFLLILTGHLLTFKHIPACLDHYYGWGAVGKIMAWFVSTSHPLSYLVNPWNQDLCASSCWRLWSSSRVKASVPPVTEWNLFHKDYESYNVQLLLQLLGQNAVLQLETTWVFYRWIFMHLWSACTCCLLETWWCWSFGLVLKYMPRWLNM